MPPHLSGNGRFDIKMFGICFNQCTKSDSIVKRARKRPERIGISLPVSMCRYLMYFIYLSVRLSTPKTQSMPMKFTRQIKFNLMLYRSAAHIRRKCIGVCACVVIMRPTGAGAAPVVQSPPSPSPLYRKALHLATHDGQRLLRICKLWNLFVSVY